MHSSTTASASGIAADVGAFVAEQGATAYLPSVMELAGRIFPGATLAVRLENDPEIENDCHIAIEVDVTGKSVDELIARQNQWNKEIFDVCPANHVCVFRLAMV